MIVDRYDYDSYDYEQIVEISTVSNETYYEQDILWARNKNVAIPRTLHCIVYNACATKTLTFDMYI